MELVELELVVDSWSVNETKSALSCVYLYLSYAYQDFQAGEFAVLHLWKHVENRDLVILTS